MISAASFRAVLLFFSAAAHNEKFFTWWAGLEQLVWVPLSVRVSAEQKSSGVSRTSLQLLKEKKYRRPHGKNPTSEHLVSYSLIGQWKTCVVQVPFGWSTWSRCHQLHVIMFTVFISVRCTFLLPERPQRWRTALKECTHTHTYSQMSRFSTGYYS